ncbi:MAG: ATP-binding cassette domain-containing protein [Alphaproteobacteria bacterium]|nr:ATP-binding cassette domain-containing protein [Alphaproteobacteria bacterium]
MGETVPRIRIAQVCKSFGTNRVLDGVDLEIGRGESVVVVGPSGIGKSVLIKCLIGLLEPDSGTIEIDGTRIAGSSLRRSVSGRFGMLFQNGALFDSLSVLENVAFPLTRGRVHSLAAVRLEALRTLARVGLGPEIASLFPEDLSGGMRKRVALARAIATDPDILLFDEPTTGLDPIMGALIDSLIVQCVRESGATALTITHDMDSARRIADRIAMLHAGRVLWQGPTSRIEASGNEVVDRFINGVVG